MPNANATVNRPDSTASNMLITVAICTRNRAAFLAKAVRSVVPQMTDRTELLIVDNASTDDTPTVAAQLAAANPGVKVVREEELGLSAARNAALEQGRGEFVLFLDDDATAKPDWLGIFLRFFSAPPSDKIAVVGGPVFNDFEVPPPRWVNANADFNPGETPKCLPYRGSWFGGNSAYRRRVALDIGMFDTRLGRKGKQMLGREESDLNLRLQGAGYELWWLPGAGILHYVSASRMKFSVMMRGRFGEGRSIAILRLKSRRRGWDRESYRVARIIGAPFHALVHLLAALVSLPRSYSKAAEHLLQACRNCGIALELFVRFKLD